MTEVPIKLSKVLLFNIFIYRIAILASFVSNVGAPAVVCAILLKKNCYIPRNSLAASYSQKVPMCLCVPPNGIIKTYFSNENLLQTSIFPYFLIRKSFGSRHIKISFASDGTSKHQGSQYIECHILGVHLVELILFAFILQNRGENYFLFKPQTILMKHLRTWVSA